MRYVLLVLLMVSGCHLNSQERTPKIKICLDGWAPDIYYLKQELQSLEFVKERKEADVYILVLVEEVVKGKIEIILDVCGQGDFIFFEKRVRYSTLVNSINENRKLFEQSINESLLTFLDEFIQNTNID